MDGEETPHSLSLCMLAVLHLFAILVINHLLRDLEVHRQRWHHSYNSIYSEAGSRGLYLKDSYYVI